MFNKGNAMNKNKYLKYIPTYCVKSVFDLDYNKLYALGKKIILTDLDNTLISYKTSSACEKLQNFNIALRELGFKIYIVSNNNQKRITEFSKTFLIDGYLVKAKKPNPYKINQFIVQNKLNKNEIIYMGDQLVTDIAGANNADLDCVLVSTIDQSSQKWYTKINRLRERRIIKKISKFDLLQANIIKETIRGKTNE